MLEPLIVLTVLNCFFMFSSTVTTCALWWQYRSHRCCFRRDSQSAKHSSSRPKNNSNNNNNDNNSLASRRQNSRISSIDRSKSNSIDSHENNSHRYKKSCRQKSRSSKYLVHSKTPSDEQLSSLEVVGSWELENGTRMSEASQTGVETKPAVVMEYSTVQKIVQILDDETDLSPTKMVIKELAARQNNDEKREYVIVREESPRFDSQTEYEPPNQVQFAA